MLRSKIDTSFPGVNTASINWMKHYLNGGDDVGAPWNGVADSVSGYTYKYSNQFELDISYEDIVHSDWITYGVYSNCSTNSLRQGRISYAKLQLPDNVTSCDLVVYRLPYPDLPGVILVTPNSGQCKYGIAADTSLPYYFCPGFAIPILDPNWKPDFIDFPVWSDTTRYPHMYFNTYNATGGTPPSAGGQKITQVHDVYYPRNRGISEDLSAWRMAGASMTLTIPVSDYYKNGTIVGCTSATPLSTLQESGYTTNAGSNRAQYFDNCGFASSIVAQDLPTSYSEVTSVKNYHKFGCAEGIYVVCHNTQPTFTFYNYESTSAPVVFGGLQYSEAGELGKSEVFGAYGLIVVKDGNNYIYPFAFTNSIDTLKPYTSGVCPVFNIPHTVMSEWNIASIATQINNQDKALLFSIKLNSYVECYISASSTFKPSVTITSPYYPRLLEYLSSFYHEHDGIYPADWNDGRRVWNMFKKFLGSDALSKSISLVSPSAGQIVSLIQSEVQRLANKRKEKDSKLSKSEKEQVRSIINNSTLVKGKKK